MVHIDLLSTKYTDLNLAYGAGKPVMSWIRGTRLVSSVNALGTGGSHLECDYFIVRPEVGPEMLL